MSTFAYSQQEMKNFQKKISAAFGPVSDNLLHDTANESGIHIDLIMTEPAEHETVRRFFTMGAGAYQMKNGSRAEFMIVLPKEWPLDFASWKKEENYWPIRLLQDMARFSITNHTFLNWYHTVEKVVPYAKNTALCSCMFVPPFRLQFLHPSEDKNVQILQIIPLYRKELQFAQEDGAQLLEILFLNQHIAFELIDPRRKELDLQ